MARTRSRGTGQVLLGAAGEPSLADAGDQLLAVYRLSDPALSEMPLQRLLEELLRRVQDILEVDTVAILLLDPEADELVARAAKGIEEEVKRGVRIPIGQGFAGRIAAERTPIFIPDVDHADVLNPLLREAGIRSLLGVPLVVQDKIVGVMHVGTLHPRTFTPNDVALLQLAGGRAAPAIEHAQLFDALDREHRSAVALQRSLLPDVLPPIPEVDVAARYLPARDEVGGDWYDVLELQGSKVGIAIGDVAGHGIRAAALMGQLRTGLRAYALEGHGPAQALRLLDELLQTLRGRGMATAAYAVADVETGVLTVASAGHPPPVLVAASGASRLLEVRAAPPLGTVPYARFQETDVTLAPGDAVVLYTDGLVETRTIPLSETLELLRASAEGVPASAETLCEQVVAALVPSRAAEDDVAVLALRRRPVDGVLQLRLAADPEELRRMRRSLASWLRGNGAGDEDVRELLLACGEACANAIEHAYAPGPASFEFEAALDAATVTVTVRDHGQWRDARGRNRGRGLEMMEAAMDEVDVRHPDRGTRVVMRRRLRGR